MNEKRLAAGFTLATIVIAFASVVGLIIYAAAHFISKYW